MNTNTFYGKKVKDMEPLELQLLGVDLNITALVKGGSKNPMGLAQGFKLRTQISNDCIKYGGNYSRQDFLNDTGFVDNFSMEEVKEMSKMMNEFEKGLRGIIKGMFEHGMKDDVKNDINEPNNGKEELGFNMN